MALLALRGIRKRFGPTLALGGVDLEVAGGEVHALIGENGAGKSTLMNVIAGAIAPDAGTMRLGDTPHRPRHPQDARRAGVAFIHQELCLCPHLTVAENILLGAEPSRFGFMDQRATLARAAAVLRRFPHPEIRPDRPIGELSVAARQVVEICRAMAGRARLVLMDEPTSSLAGTDVPRLFELVRALRGEGVGIVYISHFLDEVREVADRCTVLRDGESVFSGPMDSVGDAGLVAHMVGRSVENVFPRRARAAGGETLLRAERVSAPPRLEEATLELRRGRIVGLAGLVGAGRTDLVRAIFGLVRARAGKLAVRGEPANLCAAPERRIAQGLGYVSEDRRGEGLALPMPIADNATATRLPARAGWLNLEAQARAAETWMRGLSIRARSPWQPVRELSGGNQQKVALARVLHQEADILLLDEPTRGIDVGAKTQIYERIAACAAEGKAVLLVSSQLPELFGLCDELAVMSAGRLGPPRPIGEWTPETAMRAAIGGETA